LGFDACFGRDFGIPGIARHGASEDRCPYRAIVIVADACPRIDWSTFTSAPEALSSDAAACRMSWVLVPPRPTAQVASISLAR